MAVIYQHDVKSDRALIVGCLRDRHFDLHIALKRPYRLFADDVHESNGWDKRQTASYKRYEEKKQEKRVAQGFHGVYV